MDDAIFTAGACKGRRPSREEAEAAVRTLIAYAGEDPDREGLLDTPRRVVKAYAELFSGYGQSDDPQQALAQLTATGRKALLATGLDLLA